jgi:RimJ/RimL family protein N-acetyltransferase
VTWAAEGVTQRLRLRPIGVEVAAELGELHRDAGIAQWYGGAWSDGEARNRATAMGEQWRNDGVGTWLACDRRSGELVGRGGLSWISLFDRPQLEVGWAVRQSVWGHGFATEIGQAALDLAFDELGADEVIAFTEVHNGRSRRVMERLGLRYRRDFVRPGLVDGSVGIHPDATFALYAIACSP